MQKDSLIYVAGHCGLVGSAIIRILQNQGFSNILTQTHAQLDLTRQVDVEKFFNKHHPEYVFLAAAKVGGIWANNLHKADFIYQNLMIQSNIIHASYQNAVKKLLFLGSSCIYPKYAPQPIKEECLLDGKLEPTNEPYALAKIAGIKMCQSYNFQYHTNFISVMPTNLYGPQDNFDLTTSHVLPALIRKFHEAKISNTSVLLWGSGTPRREFLHVDDLAAACIFLMESYNSSEIVNIGTGQDITIAELANIICNIVGYTGNIEWDSSKPDGTMQKLLDISKIQSLGWKASISLSNGIKDTYQWYLNTLEKK